MDEAAKDSGIGINEAEPEEENKPNPYTHEAFYAEDSEKNILIDETGTNIKAASLPKLISKLTTGNASTYRKNHPLGNFKLGFFLPNLDPAVLKDFLLTHRSFTAGGLDLLNCLKARDATATPDDSRVIRIKYVPLFSDVDT